MGGREENVQQNYQRLGFFKEGGGGGGLLEMWLNFPGRRGRGYQSVRGLQ